MPRTHSPAQVLPVIGRAERRRVGQAGGHDLARRHPHVADPHRLGRSRARACAASAASRSLDEPSPYLNVTRSRTSTQRGMRSTSSCSTFTHSSGPMPSGKSNTSGSLNGGVVNQPRPRSHTTGGLRHSSIVRPDRERRRELVALDPQVRAVAHAELVDPREQVVGGVAGEHVGQPRLDARCRPAPAARPPRQSSSSANCSSPSFTPVRSCGASGCGADSDIAMSR